MRKQQQLVQLFCFIVQVQILYQIAIAADATKRCVTLFEKNEQEFEICKSKPCIIFRSEVPFIWIDELRMNSTEQQKPFPCAKYSQIYEDLYGPFFEIVNKIPALSDAQCVWGGTDCSYDDKINFVQRTSENREYRFIAGGLLFNLEYRMSKHAVPSVPLMSDKTVVIGPRNDDRVSWKSAWDALWRPFTTKAWAMLIFTLLSVVFLRVWISYHFTTPFTWQHFRDNLLGDYIHANTAMYPRRRRSGSSIARHRDPAELRRLNSYTTNGVKMLFILVLLYYEIAVVDFVFQDRDERIDHVSPNQFVLTENTTMENIFIREFLNSNKSWNRRWGCRSTNTCWHTVHTAGEVFNTITDRNSTKSTIYRYSYMYETFNRYWFKENASLCNELQVFRYKPLERSFAGVWYYSSNIELEKRTEIDRGILQLREKDEIGRLFDEVTGSTLPPKCTTSTSISVLLLGVPIILFPGPILSFVFFYMMIYEIRERREKRKQANTIATDVEGRSGGGGGGYGDENDDQEDMARRAEYDNDENEDGDDSSLRRKLPYMSQMTVTTCSESSGIDLRIDSNKQMNSYTTRRSTH